MLDNKKLKAFANFVGDLLQLSTRFEVKILDPTDQQIAYTLLTGAKTTYIYINTQHPYLKFKDREGIDERIVLGVIVHEVLHSKYTHPEHIDRIARRNPIQFPNVLHSLYNLLEDFTIESRAIVDLALDPDTVERLEDLLNIQLRGKEPLKMLNTAIFMIWDKQPPVCDVDPAYAQVIDALVAFTDIGPLPSGSKMLPEAEEAFLEIAKLFMDAIWLDSYERAKVVLEAYNILEPLLKKAADSANKANKTGNHGMGTTQGKSSMPESNPSQSDKDTVEKSSNMKIRKKLLKKMAQDNSSGQSGQQSDSSQDGNDSQDAGSSGSKSSKESSKGDKDKKGQKGSSGSDSDEKEDKDPQGSSGSGKSQKNDSKDKASKQKSSGKGASDKDASDDGSEDANGAGKGKDKKDGNQKDAGSDKDDADNDGDQSGSNADNGDNSDEDGNQKNAGSDKDDADDDGDQNGCGTDDGDADDDGDQDTDGTDDDDVDEDGDQDSDSSDEWDADDDGDQESADSDNGDDGDDGDQSGDGNDGDSDADNDSGSDNDSAASSGSHKSNDQESHSDSRINLNPRSVDGDYVDDLDAVRQDIVKETQDLSEIIPESPVFQDSGVNETVQVVEEDRDTELEARKYGCQPILCQNVYTTSVNDQTMKVYESVCSSHSDKIAAIRRSLEKIIASEENNKSLAKSGHFEVDRYCKKKGTTLEVFTKIKEKTKTDSAVCILADVSGSMGGDKINQEKIILACLAEALAKVGIPFKVITFCDKGPVVHHHYVNYKNSKSERAALMTIAAGGSNFDGYSIRYALKDLLKNKAQNKLLIIISDGQPNPNYSVSDPVGDARDAVIEARRRVKVIGIALGVYRESLKALRTIYHKKDDEASFVSIANEQDLITELPKLIRKEVKKW